ncbi:MAG: ArsA family ATPase [Chloroflexi bacterium]|nr:ArsA family ATPase [Chloroflexota bacterium]
MRIILYTGKGGVGKTSVAAATALRAAQMGYRTIVISTDTAHSLSDSFDTRLSAEPLPLGNNLWGQEVDILREMETHWGAIHDWITTVMAWRGLDAILAEEMAVLPGTEELASLLRITEHHDSGKYDLLIVDCAPTGETLRLLSFPEIARWWMQHIFPIERKAAGVLRPVLGPWFGLPIPTDEVFAAVEGLYRRLERMKDLLSDPEKSSIRLVLNPEKMVIKEAQRTYTYLNLYGYFTDLIICNRVIPPTVADSYFDAWKESQNQYRRLVEECFTPLPIRDIPLFRQEVVGQPSLEEMAQALFGDDDPARVYFHGHARQILREDSHYVLTLSLPFVTKEDISLVHSGDELVVQVGNQKRNILLPRVLAGLTTTEAVLKGEVLHIKFEGQKP